MQKYDELTRQCLRLNPRWLPFLLIVAVGGIVVGAMLLSSSETPLVQVTLAGMLIIDVVIGAMASTAIVIRHRLARATRPKTGS